MRGAVSTASPHATSAAIEILRKGGNAMDAAAAAAWALSVCEPSGSGLGGHTVLLMRNSGGHVRIVEGRSPAPKGASIQTVSAVQQRIGRTATTVPSTVATLDFAQRKYGRLDRASTFEPAVRLARCGFGISRLQRRESRWVSGMLSASPETAALFLGQRGWLREGEIFRQPALAATLSRLAECGADDFYYGEIAQSITCDMALNGGLIEPADLAGSAHPSVREPLEGYYRGYRVVTAPPPAGGLQLLLALEWLERAGRFDTRGAEWYAAVARATQEAFRCRETNSEKWKTLEEPGETTHLSVSDAEGNVVALTQSIQSLYGAKLAHPQLGFLYNNYLRTCTRKAGPYQLRGGCVARSNVAPTLIFRPEIDGGGLLLALGGAGSRRITSSVLQTISAVIDFGETVQSAVAAPRIHGLLSGAVRLERDCADGTLAQSLAGRFRRVALRPASDFGMGAVHALYFGADGMVTGAADPRRDGVFETTES
jgi:gamma-glutamyltranspeptidase/glutathione hydrolase